MSRLPLILIAFAICLAPRGESAETPPRPQHNFLFVVDSSISMQPRKASAIKWVREAIASRFDGQIEAGDSIDIWTYDTENNLHGFPPQIWTPSSAKEIADEAAQYLEKYKFKGKSEFANVVSDLDIFIPQTKSLLVVIITDGEQPFSGFPLDLEINGYLSKKGKLGARTPDPILISLAAINGKIRTWTAYFGEGNMGLASLPGRKAAAPTVAEKKPEPKPAPAGQSLPFRVSPKINTTAEPLSVFNFPPGTKITPVESADSPLEKPLELTATVKPKAAKPAPAKTNAVVTAKAAPAINTNTAAFSTPTNVAKTIVKPTSAPTNAVVVILANPSTNAVAALIATNQATSNSVVAVGSTKRPAGPSRPESTVAAHSAGLGTDWTIQRTFYIAGLTGASCILVGLFLLYRKFRRPTQSIISRSLLQR